MTQAPTAVQSPRWKAVMAKAKGRCQCSGECGNRHSASRGRCDTTNAHVGKLPLMAAPVDLVLALTRTGPPQGADLMAWCQTCYARALTRTRKAAKAEPTNDVPMFDLP